MRPEAAAESDRSPPQTPAGPPAPPAFALAPSARAAQARLVAANRALWAATLALMAAYLQTPGCAQRHDLALRIARDLEILSGQDCFDGGCRATFARLAGRWQARAEQLAPRTALARLLDLLF